MKPLSSCLGLLVQILRLGICVYLIYTAAYDYSNGQACKDWPTVKGKLTTAEIKKIRSKGETKFEANVQYSYMVNGRSFTADRVQFGGLMFRDPAKVVDELKSAKEINVHYHPDKPEVSCIETGFNFSVILLESIAALLIAALALIEHLKAGKAEKSSPSWNSDRQGQKLSSMPGLKQQKELGQTEASSQATINKNKNKAVIFFLVFLAIVMTAANMLDNVEIPGIPTKLFGAGVLIFGGLLIVMLISLIAPCVAFLMRRRHLALADMLAGFNAAIHSGFNSSFELALARGLQAEVAQERLQYDKALSLSKQALDVMAERRRLLNEVADQKIGVLEKQAINSAEKQYSDLESICNESIGCIYFDKGNYDDAMRHAQEAVTMAEQLMKDSSASNPSTKLALASALALRGRIENTSGSLDNAKADFKRAMSIRQEVKLPYPDRLVIIMAHLASTYTMQHEYREAERLITEGLSMVEGSNEIAMKLARATLQFHRAEMKMHLGDYDSAEDFLNECIALREKLLLPNHPQIAEAYLVAANLSQLKGRSTDAARQREKASAILRFCFGDQHPLIPNDGTNKSTSALVRQKSGARF